ncbi:gamma-mobile-trio protein GmtX [Pseudoalteromonas sp. M8]|uniref:gamma-mobile-trio protein GmtX n=1 Tax=Pseudoalteromonas sp. M8 TaxID=2692624 RepID=UPI001BACDDAD|nr:gamma-mobile-trio protein GmtX [Pseudoalteromonas sp. M8]QUI71431.1 alpha/beta hydrolase [Pseudoalteromonas sp. M8]
MAKPVDPTLVLQELCASATTRTANALTVLNAVLEQQSKITPLDFSMATIGRLSKEQGGPSTQTIRNRTGKHFQQLIEAWAAYAGTTCKKPLSVRQKQLLNSNDQHILDAIDDPVIRAVVGSLIAERNKYRDQLNTLKANSDLFIDRTKGDKTNTTLENKQLVPLEVEAIKAAISDAFFNKHGWEVMPTGQVKDAEGNEIYKRGYVNGIKKFLIA